MTQEATSVSELPASCEARAPFIPRMGLSFGCVLPAGHSGDHSSGMASWPKAPHAAAHPSISYTTEIGMTAPAQDPSHELPRQLVEAVDALENACIDFGEFDDPEFKYEKTMWAARHALDDELSRSRGELAEAKAAAQLHFDEWAATSAKVIEQDDELDELERQLSETRAERDAAVALVREQVANLSRYRTNFETGMTLAESAWLERAKELVAIKKQGS